MQNEIDRPSSETESTPKAPVGEDIKALVTPGDDAEHEAEAERPHTGAGEASDEDEVAHPDDPEEAQSPT